MTTLIQKIVEMITAFGIIATAVWFIAEAPAQDFVRATVQDQIGDLQVQLKALATAEAESEKSSIRSESDLASVKDLQRQTLDALLKLVQHN